MNYLAELADAPAATFDTALFDLDGVVYRGPDAVEHAPAAIAAAAAMGLSAMYVTNNANRPPEAVAEHLTRIGISTAASSVTTAAQAAARLVASEHPAGTRVLVIGGQGLRQALQEEGLAVVESADDSPAVVVQGFAPDVGWADLTEGLLAIGRGAEHIASNLDATLPMERGLAIGNGSLVAAIVHATGRTPRSTGKPAPAIFEQAAARAGARAPIVVGDRLDTDLEGARAAGYPGMHVLTGVDDAGAVLTSPAHQRPSLLAYDLRGLLVPHPGVVREGAGWRCRHARVRFDDQPEPGLVIDRPGGAARLGGGIEIDLDEFRAACAAAWDAADRAGSSSVLTTRPQVCVRPPTDVPSAIA